MIEFTFSTHTECNIAYLYISHAYFGYKIFNFSVKQLLKILAVYNVQPSSITSDLKFLIDQELYGWNESNYLNITFSSEKRFYINDPIIIESVYKEKEVEIPVQNDKSYVLEKAKKIVNGKRQDAYGKPEDSFKKIAGCWNWFINSKYSGKDIHLTDEDVANMMVLFKVARNTGDSKLDNYIDICGYGAIGGELSGKKDNE